MPRFKNQTIIAIKAPPEAKLHVPHPSDGLQIYMSSETGEIEVFLCPEEETRSEEEVSVVIAGKIFDQFQQENCPFKISFYIS